MKRCMEKIEILVKLKFLDLRLALINIFIAALQIRNHRK